MGQCVIESGTGRFASHCLKSNRRCLYFAQSSSTPRQHIAGHRLIIYDIVAHFAINAPPRSRVLAYSDRDRSSSSKPAHTRTSPAWTTVLDSHIDCSIDKLWEKLSDSKSRFFRDLHRALKSEKFSVHTYKSQSDTTGNAATVGFTLQYTTPLPLAGLRAANTETVSLCREGSQRIVLMSVASTRGVPLSNCFQNKILWEIRAVHAKRAHLTVSVLTDFYVPILGPLRSRIESESFKGVKEAYTILTDVLCPNAQSKAPNGGATPRITNSRRSSSMSTKSTGKRRLSIKITEEQTETEEGEEEAEEEAEDEGSDQDESTNEDELRILAPYKAVASKTKALGLLKIKDYIGNVWPEWSKRRYDFKLLDCRPTVAEAVALLLAVSNARRDVLIWRSNLPRYRVCLGLIDCLQLSNRGDGEEQAAVFAASPTLLKTAIYSLARIGGATYWTREMDVLCSYLPNTRFNGMTQIYTIVWSLRMARHYTPRLPFLEQEAIRLIQGSTSLSLKTVRHFSYIAQGLVNFGYVPQAIFDILHEHLPAYFSWRAALTLAWALAISNELDNPLLSVLLREMHSRAPADVCVLPKSTRGRMIMLGQLVISLRELRPAKLALYDVDDSNFSRLLKRASDEWCFLIARENAKISETQKDIWRITKRLGYKAQLETMVGGISVDIAVPGEYFAIEVDGPTHFARNRPELPLGSFLWKRRVLNAHGWTVVDVLVSDWTKVKGLSQSQKFLSAAIQRAKESNNIG